MRLTFSGRYPFPFAPAVVLERVRLAKRLFELLDVKPDEVSRDIDIDSARPDDYENPEGLVWYVIWNEQGSCVSVYAQKGSVRAVVTATDAGSTERYDSRNNMASGLKIARDFLRTAVF